MREHSYLSAPRGLLRILILHIASRNPVSGVTISGVITEKSKGGWRPSPGSIYFIIKELTKEGKLLNIGKGEKKYITTKSGLDELKSLVGSSRAGMKRQLLFMDMLSEVIEDQTFSNLLKVGQEILSVSLGTYKHDLQIRKLADTST
ncbi:MAG: PadR family transcriptional regulator [Nitrososphaerales archaeon]